MEKPVHRVDHLLPHGVRAGSPETLDRARLLILAVAISTTAMLVSLLQIVLRLPFPGGAWAMGLSAIGAFLTLPLLYVSGSVLTASRWLGVVLLLNIGVSSYLRGGVVSGALAYDTVLPIGVMLLAEEPRRELFAWAGLILLQIGGLWLLEQNGLPGTPRVEGNFAVVLSAVVVFITVVAGVAFRQREAHRRERDVMRQRLAQGERLEALGRLAGGVAHDFNNALTVVVTHARLAREAPTDADRASDLEAIENAAGHGTALVRKLLAFGRRSVLRPEAVSLNGLVRDASAILEPLLSENIDVELDLAEDCGAIWADRHEVEQVLMNLALNARDAMPEGGTLTLKTRAAHSERVPMEKRTVDAYVALTVSDTGMGMTDDLASRIFDPFFTTKDALAGSGLGLPSVYGSVEQAGGTITVSSTPGEGTVFEVILPAAPATTSRQPTPVPEAAHPTQMDATILLVEDDVGVRRATARLLKRAGYSVVVAGDGDEALDALDVGMSLMITDVVMPGLSGPDVIRCVRKTVPNMPVILISGYSEEGLQSQLDFSNSHYLSKPFEPDELLRVVSKLLTASGLPRSRDSG